MAHTHTNILIHALFSTIDRQPWLDAEVAAELFSYLGGVINELGGQSLLVNGLSDHVHRLFAEPPTLSIADMMEKAKANLSGRVKKRWRNRSQFAWQAGYAAFSVSKSQVESVRRYIESQKEHHRKVTFQGEVLAFLKKQGIKYDPRYVFA